MTLTTRVKGGFPIARLRRLRSSEGVRSMVSETVLDVGHLVLPLFVTEKEAGPIESMPGVERYSIEGVVSKVEEAVGLGVNSFLVFGVPQLKDEIGSQAYDEEGIVQRALRRLSESFGDRVVLIADTCLCEYTSHGHCGVVVDGSVDNDRTLELLAKTAVSQAEAGATVIAPSAMMDGQVGAIRSALDEAGFERTPIMAYSAKYASTFYGPFRVAAESKPQFGDRRGYQMDPRNRREALREVGLDVEEGADIIMVKPALPYLDVIASVKEKYPLPLAAYQVSGEYLMIRSAAASGYLDEKLAVLESVYSIRRAGADIVITYFAEDIARWLRG
ncbi:MAG: porphobilinogen synthase [Thermoprotei archaeon]